MQVKESKTIKEMHANESSEDIIEDKKEPEEEEKKEPAMPLKSALKTPIYVAPVPKKKVAKGEIEVDFQYVVPSEAYYHSIKALLNQYVDGEEGEEMDYMSMADNICERASIGQVVASPLDEDKDPE